MSKNYGSTKTGHKPSDEYFKSRPIWFDSDLLHAFLLGAGCGAFVTLIFSMSI